MRIVCLSDTHGYHGLVRVPGGDVLIHAGDFTPSGKPEEADRFFDWLARLPHAHKIVIPGNHDTCIDEGYTPDTQGAQLIIHERTQILGVNVFGSPVTPIYRQWSYMATQGVRRILWKQIPDDTQILVTHGPPYRVLSENDDGEDCGDSELLRMPASVKLHVFGHIHEMGGLTETRWGTKFVNASLMNQHYDLVNHPIVVDMDF